LRRSFVAGALAALGMGRGRAETVSQKRFPPVPAWQPRFAPPLDRIIDRIRYYWDGKIDFVVFRNGTCVLLDSGLSDADAKAFALKTLADIFGFHPDMNPANMDDGNILVRYNHPAVNVVIRDFAMSHWEEIERRHLDALATDEVLITPLGPNKFDEFGKLALYGRTYMFMDAERPEIVRIIRHRQLG